MSSFTPLVVRRHSHVTTSPDRTKAEKCQLLQAVPDGLQRTRTEPNQVERMRSQNWTLRPGVPPLTTPSLKGSPGSDKLLDGDHSSPQGVELSCNTGKNMEGSLRQLFRETNAIDFFFKCRQNMQRQHTLIGTIETF